LVEFNDVEIAAGGAEGAGEGRNLQARSMNISEPTAARTAVGAQTD
jgi:hypothetical protein